MHDAEIGGRGVPHGEAGMVLGGEDDVADAGEFGQRGPILRVEFARIEGLRQVVEEALGVSLVGARQRVGDDHAESGYRPTSG